MDAGRVDAGRPGEAVRQIEADLDGLRTSDAEFAADFVRARRAAPVRALGDPVRTSVAADRLEAVVASQLPIDAVETLPAEVASTTLDAARAVIAQDLQAGRMVTWSLRMWSSSGPGVRLRWRSLVAKSSAAAPHAAKRACKSVTS